MLVEESFNFLRDEEDVQPSKDLRLSFTDLGRAQSL